MRFSREQAIVEIEMINRGDTAKSRAVRDCMNCFACDAFCPMGLRPYEKIQSGWAARYQKDGVPLRARYLLPGLRPNFRQDLRYSRKEEALHAKWAADDPPARTCLYPGCNILALPLLATGVIFDALPVWGRWDLCCGEMYFRMGLHEPVERTARRLTDFYANKPIDELVFACPACFNMFAHILPERFGARFHFKTTFLTDWLNAQVASGKLNVRAKLSGSAVVHDSCHGRILGDAFMDSQRNLLSGLGIEVHETELNRAHGLCCGIAAGCNSCGIFDVARASIKALNALDRAGGDQIVVYCTGCLLTLNAFRLFMPFGKRLAHSLEYVRAALGETVERRYRSTALRMVAGIGVRSLPYYLSRARMKV